MRQPDNTRTRRTLPADRLPDKDSRVWTLTLTPGGATERTLDQIPSAVPADTPRTVATAASAAAARPITIIRSTDVDEYERTPLPLEALLTPGFLRVTAPAPAANNENFKGTARKAAKISLSDAEVEEFADLQDLIASVPSDDKMINRTPEIETTAGSNRVAEEERNVRVSAFLYAASLENDNDYHLIIGRDPDGEELYMNVELSGLPPNTSTAFDALKEARDAFKAFIPELPGKSYDYYPEPFPVIVQGSLFFDMSHATGGRPGPQRYQHAMPVIWEIHPISEIIFEP
jgi:hypothetical protein